MQPLTRSSRTLLWSIIVIITIFFVSSQIPTYNNFANPQITMAMPSPLLLPFLPGEAWYICQGYNGQISHQSVPALDLSIDSASPGSKGCTTATSNASSGKSVTSPGTGTVINWSSEGMCINFDAGGSVLINHIGNRRANGKVNAGDLVGTVNSPNVTNGGYAHIHIQIHSGSGCGVSPIIPFDAAHGSRFQCVSDMPFLYDSNNPTNYPNQFSGTALTRCDTLPYQGEFIAQNFQGTMIADTIQHAQVQIKNTGTQAWDSNTKIYALPRDQASPFYDPSWLHPWRIASSGIVQPGAVGTFDFILHAPLTPGQYRIDFAFVQEGITWFTSPADGVVWYPITVTPTVGAGSTRWPLFVEAFDRNGGIANLGYPSMVAQWSGPQNAPVQSVIQGLSSGAFIIHDEQKDTPPGSVPAYVISGPLLHQFQSLQGSSSWLGAGPSSDQFTNAVGQQQSNFPNGYITWDGTTAEAHAWPVQDVNQWYAEYHNGTNLNASATWIQNEASISHNWSTNAPGNGQWGVWSDHFAVRWTRRVNFSAGNYTFIANADDSMRVWIDGTLIIDASLGEQRMSQSLSAGNHDIRVEFIEGVGSAAAEFRWEATTPSPTPVTPLPTPVTPLPTPVTPLPTPVTPSPTPVTPSPTPVTPSPTPVTPRHSVYLPVIRR